MLRLNIVTYTPEFRIYTHNLINNLLCGSGLNAELFNSFNNYKGSENSKEILLELSKTRRFRKKLFKKLRGITADTNDINSLIMSSDNAEQQEKVRNIFIDILAEETNAKILKDLHSIAQVKYQITSKNKITHMCKENIKRKSNQIIDIINILVRVADLAFKIFENLTKIKIKQQPLSCCF